MVAFHSKEVDFTMDTTIYNCIDCMFAIEYLVETTKCGLK